MANFSFRVGAIFEWDGTAFKIERLHGEQDVILVSLHDGKTMMESIDEL